jgi:hypothetical protein
MNQLIDEVAEKTVVREAEAWKGLVARLLRRPLQRTLDRSIEVGLRNLKTAAEH